LVYLMLASAEWQTDRLATTVRGDFSTATDLADFLATTGMPFREAHELVGKVVRGCDSLGCTLEDLTEERLGEIAPEIPKEALSVLQPEDSVRRRESLGAPGPHALAAQIEHAKTLFDTVGFPKIA